MGTFNRADEVAAFNERTGEWGYYEVWRVKPTQTGFIVDPRYVDVTIDPSL